VTGKVLRPEVDRAAVVVVEDAPQSRARHARHRSAHGSSTAVFAGNSRNSSAMVAKRSVKPWPLTTETIVKPV
jgi:hypothetical protein